MDADTTSSSSSKRSREDLSRDTRAYPRKRALKACKTCRLRKTKCNNEKPICGFCQSLGATCVYDDAHDLSTLDPASQLIIDRLDQVLRKLDQEDHHSARSERTLPDGAFISDNMPVPSSHIEDELNMDESTPVPDHRTSADVILDWPIFGGQFPDNCISNSLFTNEFKLNEENTTSTHRERAAAEINEEAVLSLVERFLSRVHTKCPVLDVETARKYASDVAQDGFRWDGPSCLTLIMCALGSIAQSFSDIYDESKIQGAPISSKQLHRASLVKGRAYFEAARKRVSLLEASILSTQCIYLCGVFEIYNFNPLKAWRWFANSSTTLYSYLQCQDIYAKENPSLTWCSETQRLETSLYWSSYKSMCELRSELPLPTSILSEVNYPHLLPTPPSNINSYNSAAFEVVPTCSSQLQELEISSDKLREQAWFFFLTDIMLARVNARVLLNLYDHEHHDWNGKYINRMVRAADEFERHLEDWFATLPPTFQFADSDSQPSDEFRYIIQHRALEVKLWLYRPFLCYTIHHVPYASLSPRLQVLVSRAIDISIHWVKLKPVRHRNHWSWHACRSVLCSALSVLAAVKAGLRGEIKQLDEWREVVKEAIKTVRFWEDESPDMKKGREILEILYAQLDVTSN